MTATSCTHTQQRFIGEGGKTRCIDCGVLTLDRETRLCGDCAHYFNSVGYHGCRKHLMAVLPAMRVNFKPEEGTCWEQAAA